MSKKNSATKYDKWMWLCAVAVGQMTVASARAESASGLELGLDYLSAGQGSYLLGPADTSKSGIGQVLTKDSQTAGDERKFFPYGFEVSGHYRWHRDHAVGLVWRGVPCAFQFSPSDAGQNGFDTMVTGLYRYQHFLGEGRTLGFNAGLRARGWLMTQGALPSSGHAGAVMGVTFQWYDFGVLGELGIMALGIGAKDTLGIQRDGSSLRVQVNYRVALSRTLDLVPSLEIMHVHRAFYGGSLRADRAAFFWDQATLLLGLGIRWTSVLA